MNSVNWICLHRMLRQCSKKKYSSFSFFTKQERKIQCIMNSLRNTFPELKRVLHCWKLSIKSTELNAYDCIANWFAGTICNNFLWIFDVIMIIVQENHHEDEKFFLNYPDNFPIFEEKFLQLPSASFWKFVCKVFHRWVSCIHKVCTECYKCIPLISNRCFAITIIIIIILIFLMRKRV